MLAPSDVKNTDAESAAGDSGQTENVHDTDNTATKGAGATESETKVKVVYKFCDRMKSLVAAWKKHFEDYIPDRVQVRLQWNLLMESLLLGGWGPPFLK